MTRVICRFSCGATSAVATKLALAKHREGEIIITRSDTGSEHPDNERFMADCEKWFGHPVVVQKSKRFKDTFDVWETERFITSARGSSCTDELKRIPSEAMIRRGDTLVFGYNLGEEKRAERLRKANDHVTIKTPLIDAKLTKADCLAIVERAGIELPAMYKMGYTNNNCPACPKAGMAHWNKVRVDFPDQFERMAALQRKLGPGSGFHIYRGNRITLDHLPPDAGRLADEPRGECSIMCHVAEQDLYESQF
jgi:3'-phosphoadenosine 5'-phosphosulfate sulfotransferase (PAPS reductase)/FAD synthetase